MQLVGVRGETVQIINWRVSGRCEALNQTDCVEVGVGESVPLVGVRDSKDPFGGTQTYGGIAWAAFVSDVKDGRFDL